MEVEGEQLHLFLAAGSEENLKPDLVMDAFFKFLGTTKEETPVHYHRLEVYAKNPNDGKDTDMTQFVSLESLGNPIPEFN